MDKFISLGNSHYNLDYVKSVVFYIGGCVVTIANTVSIAPGCNRIEQSPDIILTFKPDSEEYKTLDLLFNKKSLGLTVSNR